MTPKEKAKELVEKCELIFISSNADAWTIPGKKCALIAVDEIWKGIDENFHSHPDQPALSERKWNDLKEYYEEVKKEIELHS
jgi:hypothetical protein